jgi:hypothetical protein
MPLARVITRNPDDARELHQQLVERGYDVEYADPSALNAGPADLEIDLQRRPLDEALRLASEWAEISGADVYIAPGALPFVESRVANEPQDAIEPQRIAEQQPLEPHEHLNEPVTQRYEPAEPEPVPEISSYVPLTFSQPERSLNQSEPEESAPRSEVLRETVANAAGIVADSLHETKEAVSQGFSDLKQRFVHERRPKPAEPSMLQRWNRALAERRASRQERKESEREIARMAREERARREARAATLARDLQEVGERESESRPEFVARAAVPVMQQRSTSPASPQPASERRTMAPRREYQRDEGAEYWRGAFTGAAAVAVILMIAWATLGTSRPPAAPHSSGQIKQDVPFGPVTLTPGASTARPLAPSAAPRQSPPQSTAARSVTPTPKPPPVRTQRARRGAGNSGVAEDEVIVHHYGATKPAPSNATAHNTGPKRISDQ